jgi:hypothetical protein
MSRARSYGMATTSVGAKVQKYFNRQNIFFKNSKTH